MMKRTIFAAAALALLAGPAVAGHCPKDAAAIDSALGKLDVSADVKSQVVALRDEGMELHAQGKHAESEDKLSEAMRTLLLGVK